jgi:hypothetical protein
MFLELEGENLVTLSLYVGMKVRWQVRDHMMTGVLLGTGF